jgi:UDP-glucose 4-epimerase
VAKVLVTGSAGFIGYVVVEELLDVAKARDLLGFTATTSLDEMLDEVIQRISRAVRDGRL